MAHADDLAIILTSEMGKPLAEAKGEVAGQGVPDGDIAIHVRAHIRYAATDTAIVEASENCPASSITSRSRLPRGTRPAWLRSHAVPPMTNPSGWSPANPA